MKFVFLKSNSIPRMTTEFFDIPEYLLLLKNGGNFLDSDFL